MCRPSCCSGGNNSGSGVGAVVALVVGLVIVTAIAHAVTAAVHLAIRFMEELLQIVAITTGVLAGIALIVLAAVVVVRHCRTTQATAITQIRAQWMVANHQNGTPAPLQVPAYRVLRSSDRELLLIAETEDKAYAIRKELLS